MNYFVPKNSKHRYVHSCQGLIACFSGSPGNISGSPGAPRLPEANSTNAHIRLVIHKSSVKRYSSNELTFFKDAFLA